MSIVLELIVANSSLIVTAVIWLACTQYGSRNTDSIWWPRNAFFLYTSDSWIVISCIRESSILKVFGKSSLGCCHEFSAIDNMIGNCLKKELINLEGSIKWKTILTYVVDLIPLRLFAFEI